MDVDLISKLLFPAPEPCYTAASFPGELIWLPKCLSVSESPAAEHIPALLLPCGKARYLAIYFHANGEDIGRVRPFLEEVRDRFLTHVLAVEYAGYGICSGTQCDEKKIVESANAALDFSVKVLQWPVSQILLIGRSIGTGPAMALAAKHSVKGLLLISPFLSLREICRDLLGPVSYLIEERFANHELMPQIRCPCMIVHCQEDTTIPPRHGRELFELCSSPKRFVLLQEGDHNINLFHAQHFTDFVVPVLDFFQTHRFGSQELGFPSWALERDLLVTTEAARNQKQSAAECSNFHASAPPSANSFCGCYRPPIASSIDMNAPPVQNPPAACDEFDMMMAAPHDESSSLPSRPFRPRVFRTGLGKLFEGKEDHVRAI